MKSRKKKKTVMIKTENDVLYNKIKHSIGFARSEKHINWLKKLYPDREPHHLFGSYSQGLKTSDYCVLPLTREEHVEAEQNKSDFAINNLHKLIAVLCARIKELESA